MMERRERFSNLRTKGIPEEIDQAMADHKTGNGASDLSDQVIVITGGAGVLGSAMTLALAERGARVVVLSRNVEKAEHLKGHERILLLKSDVRDRDVLLENHSRIKETFGPVTALVNAAGGNHADATTSQDKEFSELSAEALESVFSLNLTGTIMPCQVFARDMIEGDRGSIINISSMAADRPLTRIPAYSAAKAAVDNFTAWLAVHMAREYSPEIRVNAIAPGFFLTEQNRFLLTDRKTGDYTERGRSIVEHTPMGRLGEAQELISPLLFLLSPGARFITGIVLPVDGGFSAFSGV